MTAAFSAAQRSYDNRQPDEPFEPEELEEIDFAIACLRLARSAFDQGRMPFGDGLVQDAIAKLDPILSRRDVL